LVVAPHLAVTVKPEEIVQFGRRQLTASAPSLCQLCTKIWLA
jgi:hypothetical protein